MKASASCLETPETIMLQPSWRHSLLLGGCVDQTATAGTKMQAASSPPVPNGLADTERVVTLFVCSNCARAGTQPARRNRSRSSVPDLTLPFKVYEVLLPCAGRLQPEHVLKVIEAGSDAACVVACDEANCHHLEGSLRCQRRLDYVGRILDEVGVGSSRLILTHLPGTAREDLEDGERTHVPSNAAPDAAAVARVRRELVTRISALPRNPLHQAVLPEADSPSLEDDDDNED